MITTTKNIFCNPQKTTGQFMPAPLTPETPLSTIQRSTVRTFMGTRTATYIKTHAAKPANPTGNASSPFRPPIPQQSRYIHASEEDHRPQKKKYQKFLHLKRHIPSSSSSFHVTIIIPLLSFREGIHLNSRIYPMAASSAASFPEPSVTTTCVGTPHGDTTTQNDV